MMPAADRDLRATGTMVDAVHSDRARVRRALTIEGQTADQPRSSVTSGRRLSPSSTVVHRNWSSAPGAAPVVIQDTVGWSFDAPRTPENAAYVRHPQPMGWA
jgi:hypothetical protein